MTPNSNSLWHGQAAPKPTKARQDGILLHMYKVQSYKKFKIQFITHFMEVGVIETGPHHQSIINHESKSIMKSNLAHCLLVNSFSCWLHCFSCPQTLLQRLRKVVQTQITLPQLLKKSMFASFPTKNAQSWSEHGWAAKRMSGRVMNYWDWNLMASWLMGSWVRDMIWRWFDDLTQHVRRHVKFSSVCSCSVTISGSKQKVKVRVRVFHSFNSPCYFIYFHDARFTTTCNL